MRTPRLVLVRWHDDIIAVHGEVPPGLAQMASCDGVRVEVYDVSRERASLRIAPRVDLRPIAGFMASVALHGMLATAAVLAVAGRTPDEIKADEANRHGAAVSDMLMRIAANQDTSEKPKDERPHQQVDEEATPEPPHEESALAADVAAHGAGGSDTVSTSPSVCTPPKGGPGHGPKCRRSVVLTSLSTPLSCYVDTVAKQGQRGTLTFPCDGDGEARLTFGSRSFVGAAVGGKIDMCTGTEYPFGDGCKWTSAQRVSGSIAEGTLSFTYGEAPKPGQGVCATACEATGVVRIEGESWRRSARSL